MKLGFVEIDRNESQTLKRKLVKLASPQEKKKQVSQAATWVGYDSYEARYISDARLKPCVVFYMSRFWAMSVLNDNNFYYLENCCLDFVFNWHNGVSMFCDECVLK